MSLENSYIVLPPNPSGNIEIVSEKENNNWPPRNFKEISKYLNEKKGQILDKVYEKLEELNETLNLKLDDFPFIKEKVTNLVEFLMASKKKGIDSLFEVISSINKVVTKLVNMAEEQIDNTNHKIDVILGGKILMINFYHILAKAWFNTRLSGKNQDTLITEEAFVLECKKICNLIGFKEGPLLHLTNKFFDAAENLVRINEESKTEVNEQVLQVIADKSVNLILNLNYNLGDSLSLYESFEEICNSKIPCNLSNYLMKVSAKYKEPQLNSSYLSKAIVTYFKYKSINVFKMNEDDFIKYKENTKPLRKTIKILQQLGDFAIEKYLEVYEFLVAQYFSESIREWAENNSIISNLKNLGSNEDRLTVLNSKSYAIFNFYVGSIKEFAWQAFPLKKIRAHLTVPNIWQIAVDSSSRLKEIAMGQIVLAKTNFVAFYESNLNRLQVFVKSLNFSESIIAEIKSKFSQIEEIYNGSYLSIIFKQDIFKTKDEMLETLKSLYEKLKELKLLEKPTEIAGDAYQKAIKMISFKGELEGPKDSSKIKTK